MARVSVEHEEIVPNARGLIRTFAGHNYEFGESIADLIDNSLDAGATCVRIVMEFDGAASYVMIADNGKGIAESEIREALRPGTERDYVNDDKGKFGLGLKTASLRHCRRLTVVGRSDPGRRRIAARELDIDDIERSNKWRVKVVEPSQKAAELLDANTGTVVIWEKLGKLMGYQNAWGKRAENHFNRLKSELDEHLSMVFHRFLAREARRKKPLEIWIGDVKLEPWDPFARDEKATQELGEKTIDVAGTRGKGLVVYRPYVLPNKSKFSSVKAFEKYGHNSWNARQGLYVYRADRLIQAGGWSRLRTLDEHTKYARASIDFQRDLDDAFELNVSKNWFKLPDDLRERLDQELETLFRVAKRSYKPDGPDGGSKPHQPEAGADKQKSGKGSSQQHSRAGAEDDEDDEDEVTDPRPALESAARAAGETAALRKIVSMLSRLHPAVARELGW